MNIKDQAVSWIGRCSCLGGIFEFLRRPQASVKKEPSELPTRSTASPVSLASTPDVAPLLTACRSGDLPEVQRLLQSGIDVDEEMAEETPLLVAVQLGHLEIVELLIAYQADPLRKTTSFNPLQLAAQQGHHEIYALLLEKATNFHAQAKPSLAQC